MFATDVPRITALHCGLMIVSGVGGNRVCQRTSPAALTAIDAALFWRMRNVLKKKRNGQGVQILCPLEHRPDVIVCISGDGRKKVIGDGQGFTNQELEILHGGMQPSTAVELEYSETEQSDLDAADDRLQRAASLADTIATEFQECQKRLDAARGKGHDPYGNVVHDPENAEAAHRIGDQLRQIGSRRAEAHEIHQAALVERNEIARRIQASASARCRPVQFHKPLRSTGERLDDMEKAK